MNTLALLLIVASVGRIQAEGIEETSNTESGKSAATAASVESLEGIINDKLQDLALYHFQVVGDLHTDSYQNVKVTIKKVVNTLDLDKKLKYVVELKLSDGPVLGKYILTGSGVNADMEEYKQRVYSSIRFGEVTDKKVEVALKMNKIGFMKGDGKTFEVEYILDTYTIGGKTSEAAQKTAATTTEPSITSKKIDYNKFLTFNKSSGKYSL